MADETNNNNSQTPEDLRPQTLDEPDKSQVGSNAEVLQEILLNRILNDAYYVVQDPGQPLPIIIKGQQLFGLEHLSFKYVFTYCTVRPATKAEVALYAKKGSTAPVTAKNASQGEYGPQKGDSK
jgi:hypothetical protein